MRRWRHPTRGEAALNRRSTRARPNRKLEMGRGDMASSMAVVSAGASAAYCIGAGHQQA